MNAPGDMVDGRFELLERLGSGGMGTVWRARDSVLHREVALKAVRHDAAASDAVHERVLREARALARISHPNVVMIHHIVDDDPHPWLVMELVEGVSLQERLDDGPLRPSEAARLGRQVLAALRAADAAGIQHRDVKPANILLRADGSAVLTDFGIAALQGSTALTATGELIGSPEYIAPERIRGNDDDPASDLWSLGLVLYVCVEGVSPLRRGTTLATLAAVLDEAVPPPVRSGPLAPVLQALLVRDPAARPDAARLDVMLAQVESGTTPDWALPTMTATPPPGPTTAPTHVLRVPPAPGRSGELVVELAARVGHLGVRAGDLQAGLLPVLGSLLLAGQFPLGLLQFLLRPAQEPWGVDLRPVGEDREVGEAQVDADRLAGAGHPGGVRVWVGVDDEGGEVPSGRVFDHGDRGGLCGQGAGPLHLDRADLREVQPPGSGDRPAGIGGEADRLPVVLAGLEAGRTGLRAP